jgi:hypothetical protein
MRKLRLVVVIIAILAITGAGILLIVNWISRQQAKEELAQQAEEIAAHREAQRAEVEGRTWNHPAIADGFLLVRNGAQMAVFDLRPQ